MGFDAAEVDKLASYCASESGGRDCIAAAQLYKMLAAKSRGISAADILQYVRKGVAVTEQPPPGTDMKALLEAASGLRYL